MLENNSRLRFLAVSDLYRLNDTSVQLLCESLALNKGLRALDLKRCTKEFFDRVQDVNLARKRNILFLRDKSVVVPKREDLAKALRGVKADRSPSRSPNGRPKESSRSHSRNRSRERSREKRRSGSSFEISNVSDKKERGFFISRNNEKEAPLKPLSPYLTAGGGVLERSELDSPLELLQGGSFEERKFSLGQRAVSSRRSSTPQFNKSFRSSTSKGSERSNRGSSSRKRSSSRRSRTGSTEGKRLFENEPFGEDRLPSDQRSFRSPTTSSMKKRRRAYSGGSSGLSSPNLSLRGENLKASNGSRNSSSKKVKIVSRPTFSGERVQSSLRSSGGSRRSGSRSPLRPILKKS